MLLVGGAWFGWRWLPQRLIDFPREGAFNLRSHSMIPLVLNTPGRLSLSGVPTGVFLESYLQEWLESECAGHIAKYGVPSPCVLGREKSVFGVLISEL